MSDSDSQSSGSSYAESVSEDGEIERETRDKRNRSKTSLHSHRTNESTEYSSKHRSKQSLRYAKDEPEDYSDGDDYGDHEEEDSGVKPPQIKMKLHGVPDRGSSSKHRSGFGSEAGSTSRREGKSESRHRDREGSSSKHSDRPSTSRHRHHLERRETALESRREKKKRDDRGSRSTKFGERERDKTREQRVAGKESRSWMTLDDRDTSCVSDDERRRDRPGFISKSRYTSRHREASVTHAVTRKRSKTSRLISDKSPTYHGSAKDSSRSHFRASSSTTSNLQSTISSTVKDISKESSIKKIDPSIYVQEVEMSEEEKESSEHDDASPEASYPSNDVTTEDEDDDKTPSEVSPSRGSDEVEEAMKTDEDVPSNSSKDPDEMDQELGPIMGPPKPESMEIKEVDISNEEKVEPKQELPAYYPAIQGCRSVDEFERLNKIEEGTYGVVYRAEDKRTGGIVALKRVKMDKEKEGFPITSLREINTLLKAQHPNIVTVKEIVVGSNIDSIYIVMEYVEHDLKSLMSSMKRHFTIGEVKTLMVQLLSAVAHLHDNWILHRDLKTSNLLFSHKGILKVGDFGLAREYGSPLKAYTPVVVTLWYRAPELLLQSTEYSCPIDIWSVGCIFGEFLTMKPLFQGQSEIDQLNIIFETLGTPSEKIWPGYSELPLVKKIGFSEHPYNNLQKKLDQSLSAKGFDLINRFLTYCPEKRITAEEALKHEFFTEAPKPIDPSMFPTWPAKSEQMLGKGQKSKSPKPPSGGKLFSKQLAADDDEKLVGASGFHMGLPAQGKAAKGGFSLKF